MITPVLLVPESLSLSGAVEALGEGDNVLLILLDMVIIELEEVDTKVAELLVGRILDELLEVDVGCTLLDVGATLGTDAEDDAGTDAGDETGFDGFTPVAVAAVVDVSSLQNKRPHVAAFTL
jgi:hypothetical protein